MDFFVIDFDSTFTQVEALDELARISLENNPDREAIYKQIEDFTNLAMEGKLSFSESLEGRVKLLQANRTHLEQLVKHLKGKVSPSFARNTIFFRNHQEGVLIVSGGFKEFITPVVTEYHIKPENIYANTFVFDEAGNIIGYDRNNPLSKEGGKVILLKELALPGDVYGIGDGYSDFQLKESGLVKKFFAFTENIARKSVVEKADYITPSLDEFLYINNLPRAMSYPKHRINCLVIGKVDARVAERFRAEGYNVIERAHVDEVTIASAGILLCGEGVAVPLEQATRLKAIGLFGQAASPDFAVAACEKGIIVFDQTAGDVAEKVVFFMNEGSTSGSCNFTGFHPPRTENAHRLVHIHRNAPGVMAKIEAVFARHEINIVAQFMVSNRQIGYVITDIDTGYKPGLLKELREGVDTVRLRLIY
ncbi:HAD-IB family phosphatase [Chitinophaga horti]|uniref:phosphoserine phosphatase n=1 Tax=Chitinophaga horti TaxID=2920382 RepID=A0ABY6J835_9BACT|nr:HAD-IB family phosphatase [Chitinophaga horti]UYQ95491.1 HAD-IB family phosphatase [Chitinophaga horti]